MKLAKVFIVFVSLLLILSSCDKASKQLDWANPETWKNYIAWIKPTYTNWKIVTDLPFEHTQQISAGSQILTPVLRPGENAVTIIEDSPIAVYLPEQDYQEYIVGAFYYIEGASAELKVAPKRALVSFAKPNPAGKIKLIVYRLTEQEFGKKNE